MKLPGGAAAAARVETQACASVPDPRRSQVVDSVSIGPGPEPGRSDALAREADDSEPPTGARAWVRVLR